MKKESFVKGTFIATLAIIITKIIGVIYVIPFYKIIGTQGGALYAYAYNVYQIFLSISTAGIPIAISKLVSEYNTLDMIDAKNRVYIIGKKLLSIVSIILFFLLFTFASEFAKLILGDITGGNTIEDVVFVIRCVSFSLLIVPFLSIARGFLQGHRMISAPSISQVIEQIIRVIVILTGSYLIIKVYNGSLTLAVGVSVFAAFVGGLFAYLYLELKIKKNKKELRMNTKNKDDITNKEILMKIINYSIPLIVVSVATDIYSFIDMILLNRGLDMLHYDGALIETLVTITTTWVPKISTIVSSVGIGMCVSLIPFLTESFVKKDYKEVNNKFNKSIEVILYTTIPMVTGLIILSYPVFKIFYGDVPYGPGILRIVMVNSLVWNLHMVSEMSLQAMNKFKMVYFTTFFGFGLDALLDIPMILLFDKLGLPPYHGVVMASIVAFIISIGITLILLKKEYNLSYGSILKSCKKMILPEISMIIILVIMKFFIKLENLTLLSAFLISILYAVVGASIYIFISVKNGIIYDVLGRDYINSIVNKFKKVFKIR